MDLYNQALQFVENVRAEKKKHKVRVNISKDEANNYVIGKEGENSVSESLKSSFPNMVLIDDIYMNLSSIEDSIEGFFPSMQIDHVLISEHAIYVIETKKYAADAKLTGSSQKGSWKYADKKVKNGKRINAARQNSNHVDKLKKLVSFYEEVEIVPIVCLVNIDPKNVSISMEYGQWLFFLDELAIMIEAFEKKYTRNSIDKNEISNMISDLNIRDDHIEIHHTIYVKLLEKKIRNEGKGKRKRKRK